MILASTLLVWNAKDVGANAGSHQSGDSSDQANVPTTPYEIPIELSRRVLHRRVGLYKVLRVLYPSFFSQISPEAKQYLDYMVPEDGGENPLIQSELTRISQGIRARMHEAKEVSAELLERKNVSMDRILRARETADFFLTWAMLIRPAIKNERTRWENVENKLLKEWQDAGKKLLERGTALTVDDEERYGAALEVLRSVQFDLWNAETFHNITADSLFFPALGVSTDYVQGTYTVRIAAQENAIQSSSTPLHILTSAKFRAALQHFSLLQSPGILDCSRIIDVFFIR